MTNKYRVIGWLAVWGVLLATCGCGPQESKDPPKTPLSPPVNQEKKTETPEKPSEPGPAVAETEEPEGLKELSAEDRVLAAKQHLCPVSGEALGGMGKPIKIKVKDQIVFLCCPGCENAIKNDPDKYLAKLKKGAEK